MIYKIKSFISGGNIFFVGQLSFLIGAFFIGTALPISIIFFLISASITYFKKYKLFFKDRWNYPFFILTFLILLSAFINSLGNPFLENVSFKNSAIWLDTLNWIPLFFLFWGFQPYIETKAQKLLFAKTLISGSFPILVSCILQLWFGVYGPFSTLFDSIVWFQKPLNDSSSVSGLFSNPNYLVSWLVIILPFTFYLIAQEKKYQKKLLPLFIFFLNFYFLLQANSRNGILSFFSSLIIIYGFKKTLIIGTIVFIFSLAIYSFNNLNFINNQLSRNLLPLDLIYKFFGQYKLTNIQNFPRVEVWQKGLLFIKERPILGWGAGTFYFLFKSSGGNWDAQHLHNLPMDMAYKYGILVSVILTTITFIILFQAIKNTKNNNNLLSIERCWCAASFSILIFQINDNTYFDGKISIMIWILLAGLMGINKNSKSSLKTKKNKNFIKKI